MRGEFKRISFGDNIELNAQQKQEKWLNNEHDRAHTHTQIQATDHTHTSAREFRVSFQFGVCATISKVKWYPLRVDFQFSHRIPCVFVHNVE